MRGMCTKRQNTSSGNCVSVLVLLRKWVPQIVAHTGCVHGDCWDCKPPVEAQNGQPLTGRFHKAFRPICLAARAGFPH